jgi:hypothetical protein
VLKPTGRIIFSFLEFGAPDLWYVFEANLENLNRPNAHPLNQFMSRDGIKAWADHLDLDIAVLC